MSCGTGMATQSRSSTSRANPINWSEPRQSPRPSPAMPVCGGSRRDATKPAGSGNGNRRTGNHGGKTTRATFRLPKYPRRAEPGTLLECRKDHLHDMRNGVSGFAVVSDSPTGRRVRHQRCTTPPRELRVVMMKRVGRLVLLPTLRSDAPLAQGGTPTAPKPTTWFPWRVERESGVLRPPTLRVASLHFGGGTPTAPKPTTQSLRAQWGS